jgi:hypothetical protein
MTDERDLYDPSEFDDDDEDERLCLHEQLGTHIPAVRFAAAIFATPPEGMRRIDRVEHAYLLDGRRHYSALANRGDLVAHERAVLIGRAWQCVHSREWWKMQWEARR